MQPARRGSYERGVGQDHAHKSNHGLRRRFQADKRFKTQGKAFKIDFCEENHFLLSDVVIVFLLSTILKVMIWLEHQLVRYSRPDTGVYQKCSVPTFND